MKRMNAEQVILTRLLPKTGQRVSYRFGDDGKLQIGWWKGVDYWDNRVRFVSKSISSDDIVFDLASGLIWAADFNERGANYGNPFNWNECIDAGLALDFAGFSDWRLPNINELFSLVNHHDNNPAVYTNFFSNFPSTAVWSSTTLSTDTNYARIVSFDTGSIGARIKSSDQRMICVRGGI